MARVPLTSWNNFYVITGSAAAALTGLTFVVIALASDAQRVSGTGLHSFVTPTIVHFSAVLAISAFMCVPGHSMLSASIGLSIAGAMGCIYLVIVARRLRQDLSGYVPVWEDWIWNLILPGIAYGTWLAMALIMWRRPDGVWYGIAAAATLLLFIGIHNAWDIAVFMTLQRHEAAQDKTPPDGAPHGLAHEDAQTLISSP